MHRGLFFALTVWVVRCAAFSFPPLLTKNGSYRIADNSSERLASTTKSDEMSRKPLSPVSKGSSNDEETNRVRLGLLTFDLDDTLYPIAQVIEEANDAFARAMDKFGYVGIQPGDIDETGRKIRSEMAVSDPGKAASLTHTEVRMMAIRREMENVVLRRKLQATTELYNLEIENLSPMVLGNARRWASSAVSNSVVQAVHNAWEMERHHAAERHLFPEVMDVLKTIKKDHPGVVFGAVTDGKANPLFMTFTLAPFFDFCMGWEDDQGARTKFFKELGSVGGTADLTWIYDAAYEKYKELSSASAAIDAAMTVENGNGAFPADDGYKPVWIHVGDDLAYDVGGSAECGARTVLVNLAERYGQTAKNRFLEWERFPSWSTSTSEELEKHAKMNRAALDSVDEKIEYLSQLPAAIGKILAEEGKDAEVFG